MIETDEQLELRYKKYSAINKEKGSLRFKDLFLDGDKKQLFCNINEYDKEAFITWARENKYKDTTNKNYRDNRTGVYIDSEKQEYSWCCIEEGMFYTASTRPKISFDRIMDILGLKSEFHYEKHNQSHSIKLLNKYIKENKAIIRSEFIFALHKYLYPLLYIKKGFNLDKFFNELDGSDKFQIAARPFYDIIIEDETNQNDYSLLNGWLVDKNSGVIIFNTRYAGLMPTEPWIKEMGKYCIPPDCFTIPNNIKMIHGKSISNRWRKEVNQIGESLCFHINSDPNLICNHMAYIYKKESLCVHCWGWEELSLIDCNIIDDYALDGKADECTKDRIYTFNPKVQEVGYIIGDENLTLDIPNTVKVFKGINTARKVILHNNCEELFKNNGLLHNFRTNGYGGCTIDEVEFAEDVVSVNRDFILEKILNSTDNSHSLNYVIKKIIIHKSTMHDNLDNLYCWYGSPTGNKIKLNIEVLYK